jgi:hypothetical protein
MEDGILPHHEEFEEGILGAVILEPRLYGEAAATLSSGDFYSERHVKIWSAIGEMIADGVPVDLVTLWERLRDEGKIEDAGGSAYLTYLADRAVIGESLGYYAGIVKEDSLRRALMVRLAQCFRALGRGEELERMRETLGELSSADAPGCGRRLKPVPACDMEHIQPPPSLWADIIYPQCITQLNSEPGAGKSTIAYNICGLGAIEQPFLGIPFSKRLKSLYVDLETPVFLVRHKIELICGGLPRDLHVLGDFDLKRDYGELLALCMEEKYDLVVLDTQSRALAMEKENDNSEANQLAGMLKRAARESGCAILLIHHSTKSDEGKAVYRGRGASAIAGAVDVVVNVDVLTDDTIRMSVEKNRLQQSSTKLYIRKAGEDRFEPCETQENGEESGFDIYKIQDFIIGLMTAQEGPVWTREICLAGEKEGFRRRTIERALARMRQAGRVRQIRLGLNVMAEDGDSATPPCPPPLYPGEGGGVAESEDYEIPEMFK